MRASNVATVIALLCVMAQVIHVDGSAVILGLCALWIIIEEHIKTIGGNDVYD